MSQKSEKKASYILLTIWAALFASLILSIGHVQKFIKTTRAIFDPFSEGAAELPLPEGIKNKDRLLIQGDVRSQTGEGRWHALHESDPSNPVFYSIYLNESSEKPAGFLETASRLDPDNGWFALSEAASLANDLIERNKSSLSRSDRKKLEDAGSPLPPSNYEILDSEGFKEAIDLIETATNSAKIDSYVDEFANLRYEALPEAYDFRTNLLNFNITARNPSTVLEWKKITDLMTAALQEADSEAEFARLEKMVLILEEHNFKSIHTLIDGLVSRAILLVNSRSLRAAAGRLALASKESHYRSRELKLDSYANELKNRDSSEHYQFIRRNASALTGLAMPAITKTVRNPPEITAELLRPGVRVERAVVGKIIYSFIFFSLSLFALASWLTNRGKDNPATFLVRPRILILGVLLPFLIVMAFRYFPGGMLNDAGGFVTFWNYFFPEVAIFFILLAAPLCLLRQQAAPSSSKLKIWWPVGLAGIALVWGGFMLRLSTMITSDLLLYGPILILFGCGIGLVFPMLKERKEDFDLNGRLAPAYLFAAILTGGTIFFLNWEERYWFAQSDLEKPSAQGFSKFEEQSVQIMIEELRELKGP